MLAEEFRQDFGKIVQVVTDQQFREWRPQLAAWQKRSREVRDDPINLLYLQAELAGHLISLQEGRRSLKVSPPRNIDVAASINLNKGMEYCIKQIADGIAWRQLGYDRCAVHELATRQSPGHMERHVAIQEATEAALEVADTGHVVLLNDLTNFLRLGDLTIIRPGGFEIREVKSGDAAAGSRRAKRQKRSMSETTEFIKRRERRTDKGIHRLHYLQAIPISHVAEVGQVIAQARQRGMADSRLSDALAVEVITEPFLDSGGPSRMNNPFSQSTDGMVFMSLRHFGTFTKNLAPYSIFPLSDEDRIGILTGELLLISYYNDGNVHRAIRRRGMGVRRPSEEELLRAPKDLKPGQMPQYELDYAVKIWNEQGYLMISPAWFTRVPFEFLDENSLVDAIEEQLTSWEIEQEATAYIAFAREDLLWD